MKFGLDMTKPNPTGVLRRHLRRYHRRAAVAAVLQDQAADLAGVFGGRRFVPIATRWRA